MHEDPAAPVTAQWIMETLKYPACTKNMNERINEHLYMAHETSTQKPACSQCHVKYFYEAQPVCLRVDNATIYQSKGRD